MLFQSSFGTATLKALRGASPSAASLAKRLGASACLLGSLVSGLGCSASADIPEVVVTRNDIAFMGVPRIPGITDGSHTVSTTFDHPKGFELPDFLNPELRALSANITGRGDMEDLSFLDGMTLTLASRSQGAPPPTVVASYERDPGSTGFVGRVVQLEIDEDSNVVEYWSTKNAYYDVTLWGTLPDADWSIDFSMAFTGHFSVSSSD
jgi:hypothetical protein